MPKIRVRITCSAPDSAQETINGTFIVEAPSPLSAMAKFSGAANTMPYTGPVTNEPAEGATGPDV